MELRTLRTFHTVAKELNLTQAARALNYSQPTVTKHIKSLEEELGTPLLDRSDGKYVLTYAGEQLYRHSISILREVNMIKNISTSHGKNVQLKLQGHDYYCYKYFIPAINKMTKLYPNVTFKIDGLDNLKTIANLQKNETELGIISGNVASSHLITQIIDYEHLVLCIPSSLYRESLHIEDYFELYPIVIDQSEHYSFQTIFQGALNRPHLVDSSSDEVVQQAVLHDGMLGVVRTGRLQRYIDSGEIIILKKLNREEPVHIAMNKASADDEYISTLFNIIAANGPNKTSHQKFNWIE